MKSARRTLSAASCWTTFALLLGGGGLRYNGALRLHTTAVRNGADKPASLARFCTVSSLRIARVRTSWTSALRPCGPGFSLNLRLRASSGHQRPRANQTPAICQGPPFGTEAKAGLRCAALSSIRAHPAHPSMLPETGVSASSDISATCAGKREAVGSHRSPPEQTCLLPKFLADSFGAFSPAWLWLWLAADSGCHYQAAKPCQAEAEWKESLHKLLRRAAS